MQIHKVKNLVASKPRKNSTSGRCETLGYPTNE
jgi:hypothetical protein